MAKERMINTRIWSDTWMSNLDPIEKLLFLYFLLTSHTRLLKDVGEKLEKHMVDRFLGWKLPDDFNPDAGISFTKLKNCEPIGTNLFTATQTKEMVHYMLTGIQSLLASMEK